MGLWRDCGNLARMADVAGRKRRVWWSRSAPSGAIIGALATLAIAANTGFEAPPRFDGAGYAVLARSWLEGRGYREIDHPDAPPHAHYPPGYSLALAALWGLTGPSARAAHAFSIACTVGATIAAWAWFRGLYPSRAAFGLGLALAVNWSWGRAGGEIQSEPLYLLLGQLAILVAARIGPRSGWRSGIGLGALLGACILVRHVGIALALAVGLDLLGKKRTRVALVAAATTTAMVLPWVGWLALVRRRTQVELLARGGLVGRVAGNARFYMERLPDAWTGPLVEIATVFRPAWRLPALAWALIATAVLVGGWLRLGRSTRRRLAALVPAATLPLLLIWPFTEAGRFLIPIVPMILLGIAEGLAALVGRLGLPRARAWASLAVLAGSIPYAGYAIVGRRAEAARRTQAGYDAACAWIVRHGRDHPGPILTRHPGEAFWQTGRHALAPAEESPEALDDLIRRYGVAYLLVDEERYARAPASPLGRYVARRPGRVARAWAGDSVAVFEVRGDQRGPSKVRRP